MKYILLRGMGALCIGLLSQVQVHANAASLSFSQDASVVSAQNPAFTQFTGSSSVVFSVGEKRRRIGTTDSQLIGAVRESSVATPYGQADLLQATYGRTDFPFQYTLKIKRLQDINAFTVQAVIHNRSDEDIRLHNFDLFDMRKGMRGALDVADPAEWLVTPLMEDSYATTYDKAEKRLNESALFKNSAGEGFLVGPVGPAEAYTNVQFSNQELIASVAMDNVLVAAGTSRRSEEMIFCFEPTAAATNIWTRWVAATHGARLHQGPVYGWCSWYDTTTRITAEHVLNVTDTIESNPNTFGKGIIQIDDGYQKMDGDWSANEKFPMGMAAVAQRVRESGNIPGVWFAPLMINPEHPWIEENPDAIQTNAQGIASFMNANPFHPAGAKWVNPDHPATKKYLHQIITDARDRGFGYIKIDFNGIGSRFVDQTKTRLQVFRDLYTLYRDAAGEDIYILSCLGQPTRGVVGFIDAARVGPDSHPAHFYKCLDSVLRFQIYDNVWWQNDPDVAYVSPTGTKVDGNTRSLGGTPQGEGMWKTWHNSVGLVGGTSMISDPIDGPDVKDLWRNYEILRPAHTETSRLLTLGKSPENAVFGFAAQRPYGDFAVYNLYNPRHAADDHRNQKASDPEYKQAVTIDFAEAGLPAGVNCAVFDFWENKVIGYAKDRYTTEALPGLSSRLLRFTPMIDGQSELPILVGSNLHLAMGATEIANIAASSTSLKVELTDAGAQTGSLTFYSKKALKAVDSENCEITSVEEVGENLWQVNLTGRQWGTIQLLELSL
jgi:alpha-galactosidase